METHSRAQGAGLALPDRAPDLWRLAGEDLPAWLTGGLALVAAAICINSVSVWTTPAPPPPQAAPIAAPASIVPASIVRVPAPPPRAALPAPAPLPHAPATMPASLPITPAPACFSAIDVPFTHNSAAPQIKGLEAAIAGLAHFVSGHPNATVLVEGHTDASGTEGYNVLLSYARAKAVAAVLGEHGIPARRLSVQAALADAPAMAAGDQTNERPNERHVRLRIDGLGNCKQQAGGKDKP